MSNLTIHPTLRDIDGMAVIGRTLHDLRGIRFEGEEGGNAPAGDAAAQAAAAAANGAGDDSAPWTKDNFDPDRAWRRIEKMQADREADRVKHEAAITAATEKAKKDTLAEFGRLLSGGEVEETDPVKLKAKVTDLSTQIQSKDGALTTAQASLKARDLTIAVLTNPVTRDANTKLLLANEEFKNSIASVEPTDEAAITAAITKALQANAALKATPSRSGGGEHQGATVQSLEAQLAAATQKRDFTETIRLKQAIATARQRAAQA